MPFVPVTAQPCPEPETKVFLTYNFTSSPYESCYGGYYQGTVVRYSCTVNQNLGVPKTMQCRSEGRWIEMDPTPWPTCNGNSGKMSFKILHLIREYNQ
jgi:hypothetical protein